MARPHIVEDGVNNKESTVAKTKQQKKEEGRLRAIEIAVAKQNIDPSGHPTNVKCGKRANRKSDRHGARNQHRHKHFARWILDKFPHVLEDCAVSGSGSSDAPRDHIMHVLDVAGGKGELSARLSLCHKINVVMIDPRPANIASVYTNSVVPKLPKKWQQSIEERLEQSPTFVQDMLDDRFSQLIMPFSSPSLTPASTGSCCYQEEELDEAVRNASLLVGLHADGATEAIVEAALSYHKPFVVVPCCVFPNLFRDRYILIEDEDTPEKQKRVPVRTHDQFCKYLLAMDSRFKIETLPFEGRNVAIYWDGKNLCSRG